jgi:hypothetical protein
MDTDGDFVVAWHGYGPGDTTPDVFAQRFNAAGVFQGPAFRVNTFTAGRQVIPAVAMDADGDFVITWDSYLQATDGINVYARRYSASGTPLGDEFLVSPSGSNYQLSPSVAMDGDGDFVVVWWGHGAAGDGTLARRFNAAGQPQGDEFFVNVATVDSAREAAVAMSASGDFAVVWESLPPAGNFSDVYARRFDAAGVPTSSPLLLTAHAPRSRAEPAVSADADGNVVAAWNEVVSNSNSVFARRINAAGAPQGVAFPVQAPGAFGSEASVAMDADGDFVVGWESYTPFGAFARRYDAAGVPLGAEFAILKRSTGVGDHPAVAVDADGDWVAVLFAGSGNVAQRFGRNEAPTTGGLPNVSVTRDAPDTVVNLWAGFDDVADEDAQLAFAVVGNTNPGLFSSTAITPANGRLTLDYAPGQTGQATLTLRATDTGGLFTETSFVVTVTPPLQVTGSEFVFQTPPHRLRVTFNQDVSAASLGLGDLTFVLVGLPSPPQLTPSAVAYDPATRTVTFTLPPSGQQFLANGNYRATLAAGSVTNTSGIPLAAAFTADFFVLAGDFNRDRAVNTDDFIALASNFGRPNRTYAQGDADGNGTVDSNDFVILAANFGKTSPAPAAAAAAPSGGASALGAATAARRRVPLRRRGGARPRQGL